MRPARSDNSAPQEAALTSSLLRIANAVTRYMGVLILACSALALGKPELFRWVAPYVTPLLGCIMFGMGMTLRL